MAKRKTQNSGESTVLTIAFILSVLTSIGLMIALGIMFQSTADMEQAKIRAENETATAKQIADSAEYVNQIARHVLGDPSVTRVAIDTYSQTNEIRPSEKQTGDAILQKYEAFQKSYPGLAADTSTLNYENVPGLLTDKNKQLLGEKKLLETEIASLTSQLNVVRTAQYDKTAQQLTSTSTQVGAAQKDLADFRTDRQATSAAYDTAIKKHADELASKDQQLATKTGEIENANQRLSDQEEKNLVAQLKARPKSERFEIPDGKITSINEASGTVWINIGSRDQLKPLTSFSVYPASQLGVMRGPRDIKAKIEVLKILDGQFAECRIVEDSINDPILIGDQIYSPLWQRGIRVHFALVGFFDLDDDGKSDREKVKNIIRSAGGIIDAELSIEDTSDPEKANLIRTGNITVDTQYLVRGYTDEILNIDRQTYNRFETRAKDYNVESITINSLLNFAGYKNTRDATGLSRGFDNATPKALVKPELPEEDKRNQLRFPPR